MTLRLLLRADARWLPLPECSVDAVVCDPPYLLSFMGKEFDSQHLAMEGKNEGQKMQAWHALWTKEALRVLRPGGHLVGFGGARTYHRLVCAVEDTGFEIRDCLMFLHGQGFPKSMDVSKAIDREAGVEREITTPAVRPYVRSEMLSFDRRDSRERERRDRPSTDEGAAWDGWASALKPAFEPIVLARKPLSEPTLAANVLRWGTGALNINATRIETDGVSPAALRRVTAKLTGTVTVSDRPAAVAQAEGRMENRSSPESYIRERPGELIGRWPANLILECSCAGLPHAPECVCGMLDEQSGHLPGRGNVSETRRGHYNASSFELPPHINDHPAWHDKEGGGASRFFYCPKVSREERGESDHPTMKPVSLMRWLCRLVTPPGGIILDCFSGSGSTGIAAIHDGFRFIGADFDPHHCTIARRRMREAEAMVSVAANEAMPRKLRTISGPLFDP